MLGYATPTVSSRYRRFIAKKRYPVPIFHDAIVTSDNADHYCNIIVRSDAADYFRTRHYRTYGWSLLDRDTAEALWLDQESNYKDMVNEAYFDGLAPTESHDPSVTLIMIGWQTTRCRE